MANSQNIRAGAAYVELFLTDSKFTKGLDTASRKLKAFGDTVSGWGQKLAAAGAAVVTPLLGSAKAFSEMGDKMAKMSQRTGVSVESLSELAYAAELSGTDVETLEGSLRKMQKTLIQAADGSQTATGALARLGLTVNDLRGLSPDEQFKLIADRLSKIESPALKAATAMAIFGKTGTQLLPMMSEGAAGIDALQQQARDLGLTMSTQDARAAVVLNEAFNTLWKVVKQGVFIIGSALAPTLLTVTQWITQTIVTTTQWIERNKDLVVTVLKVAVAVVAGVLALIALGYAISTVGTIIGVLVAAMAAVGTAIGIMGTALAALLTPIGLVTAAVTALVGYVIYASGLGGKALEWLGQKFMELSQFARDAFQGISDAIVAGDIALAAKILWLSLQIAWIKGVAALQSVWLNFRNYFIKLAYDAFYGVQSIWEVVGDWMITAWIELSAFASKTWNQISSTFQMAWNTAVTFVEKRIHDLWKLMDDSYDAEGAKAMADKALESTNKQIDAQTKAATDAREKQRKQERKDAAQVHGAEMAKIYQDSVDKEHDLDADKDKRIKESEDQFAQARKEWQDAIAQAHKERSSISTPERLKPGELADYLNNVGQNIQATEKKTVGVAGTFNAVEARGLGAGSVADRIARAAEETAKNTKKLVDQNDDSDNSEFD